MRRVAVVHDMGAASVLDVAAAFEGFAIPVFVCPESQNLEQPRELMDEFGVLCDIAGLDLGEAVARLRACAPDAIVTYNDYQLETTAVLAAELGLPFHSLDVVRALTRKHLQRELLNACGASAIPTRLVTDRASALRAFAEIGGPAVLKPNVGTGSRSTYRIRDPEELRDACAEIFPQGEGATHEDFVLEREIPGDRGSGPWGDYVSVESAIQGGRIEHMAVIGKFPLAKPFRESGSFLPAALAERDRKAVLDIATLALQGLGVSVGVCHTEIKLSPQGPQVIEVNGRLGGLVNDLLTRTGELNAVEIAARLALGDEDAPTGIDAWEPNQVSFVFAKAPPVEATQLLSLRGADDLQAMPEISRVMVQQEPGARIDWRQGRLAHTYVCYGATRTHDDLARLLTTMDNTVQVAYK